MWNAPEWPITMIGPSGRLMFAAQIGERGPLHRRRCSTELYIPGELACWNGAEVLVDVPTDGSDYDVGCEVWISPQAC